jgi:hypothetical protein
MRPWSAGVNQTLGGPRLQQPNIAILQLEKFKNSNRRVPGSLASHLCIAGRNGPGASFQSDDQLPWLSRLF